LPEPRKLDHFWLESPAHIPRLGGAQDDKGFAIFGEGVHIEAGVTPSRWRTICRKAGISQATYFNWKKKYDGLLPAV